MRILIILGLTAMGVFAHWFFDTKHIGNPALYWLLNIAIIYKLLRLLHEWYHYADIQIPLRPKSDKIWTVDILTTYVAGEPLEMIEQTLRAIQTIPYPHQTYLCDEADDPRLKRLCRQLGVHHVYRGTDKTGAKAGNINFALEHHAKGEIAVILDPDHQPIPELLDRVLPYFENSEIGYVQSVQAYRNQEESLIAKGAAQQTYQFYGPFMMSMHAYGTVQAIGANCVFRRSALDSIGGHAFGLAEDMHTSMLLHAKGWKSLYIPEILTRGLVPSTLSAYYKQQLKWARGVFELLFFTLPSQVKKYSWRQKIHYFTLPFYYLTGLTTLIDFCVPIIALIFAIVPWHINLIDLSMMVMPLGAVSLLIRQFSQRWLVESKEQGFHILGGTLRSGTWWIFLAGLFYTLLRIPVPYIPTEKQQEVKNAWKLSLPNIGMIAISLFAILYGLFIDWNPYTWMMAGFAATNIFLLLIVVSISQQEVLRSISASIYGRIIGMVRDFWHGFRHRFLYKLLRNGYVITALLMVTGLSILLLKYNRPQINISRLAHPVLAPLPIEESMLNQFQWFELEGKQIFSEAAVLQMKQSSQQIGIIWQLDSTFLLESNSTIPLESRISTLAHQFLQIDQGVWLLPNFPNHLSSIQQKQIWKELFHLFQRQGISSIYWLWNGSPEEQFAYPGDTYVDRWINLPDSPSFTSEAAEIGMFVDSVRTKKLNASTTTQISSPFSQYIRGIAYDPAPHWLEGSFPLTRRQIQDDFRLIKQMGANTIRRYRSDVFNRNILQVAEESHLQVLMGFELDPSLSYEENSFLLQTKKNQILETVAQFHDHPAVIGWIVGNETWSNMRFHFHQPELNNNRQAYLQFLQQLSQEIQAIDSLHPVIVALEGEEFLASALKAYLQEVPSIDMFGINALNLVDLQGVDSILWTHSPSIPYLITEFGPEGYWNRKPDTLSNSFLREPSSVEKAQAYLARWNTYIDSQNSRSLGGIAYRWRDTHEGTSTWYGITDMKGRIKPAYYALQSSWTHIEQTFPLADAYISEPDPLWYRRSSLHFSAITPTTLRTDVSFEWYMKNEQLDGPPSEFSYLGNGRSVEISPAPNYQAYRLYLYISDHKGHVITCSQRLNP